MKIALVITVKNEARLLRDNLLYHKAIGVSKAFVYFDGTTDDGRETIKCMEDVVCNVSVDPKVYKHLDHLKKFTDYADAHHTARQCLNTYDALQKCKAEGIDWLISIDADELIVPHITDAQQLTTFFETIPASTDVVTFQVKELLQNQLNSKSIFAEAILFKSQPHFKRRIDKVYKRIYDPINNTYRHFNYWYGHAMGKSAIRVEAEIIPHNVHRYIYISGSKPQAFYKGYVLHYHSYDVDDFIKKFENFKHRPSTFLSGNSVEDLKLLWRDVVNHPDFSKEKLEAYYKENVMFEMKTVKQLIKNKHYFFIPRKEAAIESITVVAHVFKTLRHQ